jgi:hypothetical protein
VSAARECGFRAPDGPLWCAQCTDLAAVIEQREISSAVSILTPLCLVHASMRAAQRVGRLLSGLPRSP